MIYVKLYAHSLVNEFKCFLQIMYDATIRFLYGKFNNKRPVGKPRTRWEDFVRGDTSQILGIRRWRRAAETERN